MDGDIGPPYSGQSRLLPDGCCTSSSGHRISRTGLSIPATRQQVMGKRTTAQKQPLYAAASCCGVEWRAAVDEDGQHCFAVAL
jgi:hypothetical protein